MRAARAIARTTPGRDWSGRLLALLSLAVALAGLGYNTWRNETTESHRNVRQAAFVLLEQAGQLQQIVDNRHYGGDRSAMTHIDGWGKAALIRDLGALVSPASARAAREAFDAWATHADHLGDDDTAEAAISAALNELRMQVLADLARLR
ncbi:hypothetical protein MBSD_n0727 [Mizugakiibacter sediminis]|uniref:CHASE3 domain-containing protein n=1 Tax=Mizugakiibacter sediminis TaxID=1475481 RepID=A0A0K8QLX0_9GAMM|nr:hypothetical protein [Mizugakiibacter sediminis]GAP65437.1 hypothetical protein MBSD_n0727 [Mizugakiibacter sediminis]